MSLWTKVRGLFGARGAAPVPAPAAGDGGDPPASAAPWAPAGGAERLEAMARGRGPFDEARALAALDEAVGHGDEARGLDAAAQLSVAHPRAAQLRLRVAELRAGRGDDAGAWDLLAPWTAAPDAPVGVLTLAAEVGERIGRAGAARRLYERVLARDAAHPGSRQALVRLAADDAPSMPSASATLMTEASHAPDRYRIEAELGRGGAGTVFAALDARLGRRVALKVYHRRGGGFDPRLRAEAATPAALEHPGVVRVFDLDEDRGSIAMEWIEGGALRDRIARGESSLVESCRLALSAVDALAYVHARGVVHRDLKPSNILVRADGSAVLTDFGLSLRAGESPAALGIAGEGTPRYMPPEQRAGGEARPESDVHALGVALGELFASVRGEVPPALLELCAACARATPVDRPTLGELRRALALHGRLP